MTDDEKDKFAARKVFMALGFLVTAWTIAAVLMISGISPSLADSVSGVGWGQAAIYAFFLATTLMILFSVFGDGGMFGEIGFMLIGFFVLFFISWPFIAIIF